MERFANQRAELPVEKWEPVKPPCLRWEQGGFSRGGHLPVNIPFPVGYSQVEICYNEASKQKCIHFPRTEVTMKKSERFFTHPLGVAAAAAITMFLWGSAFPVIKKSYSELAITQPDIFRQMLFAGYRFVLAGLMISLQE
jgi:hypothetical protein